MFNEKTERAVVLLLAAINFTHIMDFVIMMPLGPLFMRVFAISPQEFSVLLTSYGLSAAVGGLIGSFFLDRFDRKTSVLFLYAGFALGTLFCALAPNYYFLLIARVITGAFGGILTATALAILGEAVPEKRRGNATGIFMAAFSAASVIGVPAGLKLADLFEWHMPFFMLAFLSAIVWVLFLKLMPVMRHHVSEHKVNPVRTFVQALSVPGHWVAFLFMISIVLSGFSVIPFLAAFFVQNLGMLESDLPYIYLVGGLFTFFTSQIIGKLSDKFGKKNTFIVIASLSMIPIFVTTQLQSGSFWLIIAVTTVFMIIVSGRFVPAMSLITSSAVPRLRGAFMSLNSTVQQTAMSVAALVSGFMLEEDSQKHLLHFDRVGYFALAMTVVSIVVVIQLSTGDSHVKKHG